MEIDRAEALWHHSLMNILGFVVERAAFVGFGFIAGASLMDGTFTRLEDWLRSFEGSRTDKRLYRVSRGVKREHGFLSLKDQAKEAHRVWLALIGLLFLLLVMMSREGEPWEVAIVGALPRFVFMLVGFGAGAITQERLQLRRRASVEREDSPKDDTLAWTLVIVALIAAVFALGIASERTGQSLDGFDTWKQLSHRIPEEPDAQP